MIVLFENGMATLLLDSEEYDANGNIQFGDVVNGAWRLEVRNGEFLAKDGNHIVTSRPAPDYDILEVPESVNGDYNQILQWAQYLYEQS